MKHALSFPACSQADQKNNLLRIVNLTSGLVSVFAGGLVSVGLGNFGYADGLGSSATFYLPTDVAMDQAGVVAVVVSALFCRSTRRGDPRLDACACLVIRGIVRRKDLHLFFC